MFDRGGALMNSKAAVDTQDSMVSLEVLLHEAARAANWEQSAVHRCAWCGRIASRAGDHEPARDMPTLITTDGMCEVCGRKALALLATRPRLLKAARAA